MHDKPREELERRMDELARKYAETHDPVAKVEVEAISRGLAGMWDNYMLDNWRTRRTPFFISNVRSSCQTALGNPAFFFFQAEDGIRDFHVTGVQTCALPIFSSYYPKPLPLKKVVVAAGLEKFV